MHYSRRELVNAMLLHIAYRLCLASSAHAIPALAALYKAFSRWVDAGSITTASLQSRLLGSGSRRRVCCSVDSPIRFDFAYLFHGFALRSCYAAPSLLALRNAPGVVAVSRRNTRLNAATES